MENKFEIKFPDSFNHIQTIDYLIDWSKLVEKDRLRKIRELRIKKINILNNISDDNKAI